MRLGDVSRAVLRKDLLVLKHDPILPVFIVAFPLLMISILSDGLGKVLGGNGADHAVPGFTVLFGFYLAMFVGTTHFREHGWGAWAIVRVSGLSKPAMVFNLLLPYYLISVVQMLLVIVLGHFAFGAHINGSRIGFVLLVCATSAVIMGIALLLLDVAGSITTLQNLSQLVVFGLGAISSTLVPSYLMPSWSLPLQRFTPQYWAFTGLRSVLSENGSLGSVLPNVGVLLAIASVSLVVGTIGFDPGKDRHLSLRSV